MTHDSNEERAPSGADGRCEAHAATGVSSSSAIGTPAARSARRAGRAAFAFVLAVTVIAGAIGAAIALASGAQHLAWWTLGGSAAVGLAAGAIAQRSIALAVTADNARRVDLERRVAELEATVRPAELGADKTGLVLATMSHELRTPLTAILGFTDLLLDPNDDVTVLRSHAQTIRRNCQHLLNVLNDVLDISRLDAGMVRIDRKPTDPVQLVREIVDLLEPRAREKHLELDYECGSGMPTHVALDVFRVRQVLLNLVGNAVTFTEEGRVVVHVTYDVSAGSLSFSVVDTGPGIPREQQELVFQPFQRGAATGTRRTRGTGLGLAISKRLAQRMGGDIGLVSSPGRGSTFTLRFPAEPVSPNVHPTLASGREDLEPWLPRPSWRVLVVEDTLEHQKLVYSCLRRAGHQVEVCDNGERALHRVRESAYLREPYTVVLLDVHLGGTDGAATATSLRQHGFRGPILAMTADATPETRERCLASGCDDVYVKPIDRAALLSVLSNLVRGAASADVA